VAETRPPMVLIAGGPSSVRRRGADPLLQSVIRRTGVPKPKVAYVGAASGDNQAFLLLISRMLVKAGAGTVTLARLCGRRADPGKARAVLEDSDLVFVSGGDVEKGMEVLAQTGAAEMLVSLYRAGKPFCGVSAGSIMLARHWVRWRDPDDESSAELFPCLDLAPVLCDTHGEEDGWEELQAALALCRTGAVGYGIVTGSALEVSPDGAITAVGGPIDVFRKTRAGVEKDKAVPAGGSLRGK
jgi:peptidase E